MQHNYRTRFDFIIENLLIIGTHGIWPKDTEQFRHACRSYYQQRKRLAEQEFQIRRLPLIMLSSDLDLFLFESIIKLKKNPWITLEKLVAVFLRFLMTYYRNKLMITLNYNKEYEVSEIIELRSKIIVSMILLVKKKRKKDLDLK